MSQKFTLIAGPCVVETEAICKEVAEKCLEVADKFGFHYIFKSSYKKANRTSVNSFTSIGEQEALGIIQKVKSEFKVPALTDVHETTDCELVKEVVDVLQIPAFLCRQTELLVAAGQTGKIVNVKKGQFMSPEAMQFAVDKVKSTGNENVWLTERGSSFGYHHLVVDFTGIPVMQGFCDTVILDATHALQQPNQSSGVTAGRKEHIATLCKAGAAVGVNGLFLEVHPEPEKALSDKDTMLQLGQLEGILQQVSDLLPE